MPNPLKRWQLQHKPPQPDKKTRIIPLREAPKPVGKSEQYTVIFSRKIRGKTKTPNLKGLWFSWEGESYYVVSQETIADKKTIRELDYEHRGDGTSRVYIRATLEKEEDDLFALLKGIRKS